MSPEPMLARSGVAISEYHPSHGDHLCSLWTDPATDRVTARAFLRGSDDGEASLAILDPSRDADPAAAAVGDMLRTDHIDLFSTDQVHVDGGVFDPDRMRRFWSTQSDKARDHGRRHLRAVAEMAWAIRELPGTDEAPGFESSLNPHFATIPASVICQYGSTRFGRETLLAMVLSHPMVVIGETVFRNPFHVGHDRFSQEFEILRRDPLTALMPIWSHFLGAQPSLHAVGRFLCNSLPTLMDTDKVFIALNSVPPLMLEVSRDRIEPVEETQWQRMRTAERRARPLAAGPWGTVHTGEANGTGLLTATLGGDRHTVTVARDGGFSERDTFRFVLLAWDMSTAIKSIAAQVA